MANERVLLFTDIVDSTRLTERLGDEAASTLWAEHDRIARRLLRQWQGVEIDKSDGFLLMFSSVDGAIAYALALHKALRGLQPPLSARAGIHRASMVLRESAPEDQAMGAKRIEIDGVGKAVAARIMSLAQGGQTLVSSDARRAIVTSNWQVHSHGHWRMKGLAEPLEVLEVGDAGTIFAPPPDGAKCYRVVRVEDTWMPVAEVSHGLPAERDGFVGRADALEAMARRFDEGARLVTVLGIGGMGKTRLALRYARQWMGDYPGGAWFCDLSAARTLEGILHAVALGLGVPLGKADPVEQLGAAIAGRDECLVILDNFEQVARYAGATLGVWIERASRARFVVTSREVLGISGEVMHVLSPLPIPDALRLFEWRAVAVSGEYAPSGEDRHAMSRLIELLDCMPLAIELAAARVRLMSPRAMLERMGERFRLLASRGGRHDRQATLRTTLDWSWELLSADEQSVLAQLSVFEGGFTLEAAEAIVDCGPSSIWVGDLVQSLVEKSLIRTDASGRFTLLLAVGDYAAERLDGLPVGRSDSPARARVTSRHRVYFAGLGELAAGRAHHAEVANVVAACRRALEVGHAQLASQALVGAWAMLKLTGPLRALADLAEEVVSCALGDAVAESTSRWIAGTVRYQLGQIDAARAHLERARALAAGDLIAVSRAACALGELESTSGHPSSAEALFAEAGEAAAAVAQPLLQCRVLNARAAHAAACRQAGPARDLYSRALRLAVEIDDQRWQAGLLGNLAGLDHASGDLAAAGVSYERALDMARIAGDWRWEGNLLSNLGLLRLDQNDFETAETYLNAAHEIARQSGHAWLHLFSLCNLGLLAERRGHAPDAIARFKGALDLATNLADQSMQALCLIYLVRCHARSGLVEQSRGYEARARLASVGIEDASIGGLLACASVDRAIAEQDTYGAANQLKVARTIYSALGAEPSSELGRELMRLSRLEVVSLG